LGDEGAEDGEFDGGTGGDGKRSVLPEGTGYVIGQEWSGRVRGREIVRWKKITRGVRRRQGA